MADSGGSGDYSALSPKEAPSAGCKSMQPEAGICEHGAPRRFRFNAIAAGAQRLMVMVQMRTICLTVSRISLRITQHSKL